MTCVIIRVFKIYLSGMKLFYLLYLKKIGEELDTTRKSKISC